MFRAPHSDPGSNAPPGRPAPGPAPCCTPIVNESARRERPAARAGEKALALRQYHECRSVLLRELGVEASAETRGLYVQILEDRDIAAAGVVLPTEARAIRK